MTQKKYSFKDIFLDDSKNISRIKLGEITNIGNIAVIDQSRTYIAGYVEESIYKICKDERIIFGDHTRIIKYINIPFITGADGVKTLKLKDEKKCLYKFFYYYLQYLDIPNNGYSRHFKFLKEKEFAIPPIESQEKVIENLEKIEELIENKEKQMQKFDEVVKSQFVEMFENEKYPKKCLIDVCEELFAGGDVKKEHTSKERTDKYKYPIYTNGEKLDGLYGYTDIIRVDKEAVTISARGTIGFSCIRKEPFYPAVRLIVAIPNKNIIDTIFLRQFIENKNYGGQGAGIPQLTVPMVKNEQITIPPIELQKQFANFVKQIDKQKEICNKIIYKLNELKKSKMQEYFGGVINE